MSRFAIGIKCCRRKFPSVGRTILSVSLAYVPRILKVPLFSLAFRSAPTTRRSCRTGASWDCYCALRPRLRGPVARLAPQVHAASIPAEKRTNFEKVELVPASHLSQGSCTAAVFRFITHGSGFERQASRGTAIQPSDISTCHCEQPKHHV